MNAGARQPSGDLLPAVWKLLGLRLRITLNSFRHAGRRNKFFRVLGTVALVTLAGFAFWGSSLLLGFLQSPELAEYVGNDAAPLLDAIPVLIFSAMFLGILLTSFGVLLQALYLSGDMDFLLASPVPIRAVFVTKLLQAVLPNFGLLALFGLPVLYGLGASRGYNLLYYPLVLLTMIALTLAAAGLSSLLVMLVVRVFPAKRVAEVLGFVGATVSILCSQSGNLLRFRRGEDVSGDQLSGLLNLVVRLNNPWLPLNWAGRGLVELGGGNWLLGITLVTLTLGLFAGAFWFALVTAEGWYYTGWAGMQVVARAARKRSVSASYPETTPRGTIFSRLEGLLSAPVRGIIQKDFLVLRRDLRNLSQLVTPLIFGVIYALAFLRGSGSSSRAGAEEFMQYVRPLLAYGNVGVAIFVGWNILTRLGGMAFSMEGKNYWMLKVSPVRAADLLKAKFLVAYLPTLLLGGVFLLAISVVQHTPLVAILFGLVVMSMCLAGMSGILIGFGAAGAQLTWEDPRKMNSGTMGCIGMILTALFVPFSFGLFIGPLLLAPLLGLPQYYGYVAGLVLGISVSAFSAILPLWLARKKVDQLGEG
jgi:ABC-2 type transport system permease protein